MARKVYSSKSHLENLGDLRPNESGSPDDRGNGLPREAVAFLHTLSGPESAGDYNVIYRGDQFNNYDAHPKVWVKIPDGPQKGKFSAAAGKYQFIPKTWAANAAEVGVTDFSPASQDKVAWHLAQKEYRRTTGRDLLADLQDGDPAQMMKIPRALHAEWDSLPGGGQPGTTAEQFVKTYNGNLSGVAGHPVPPRGIPPAAPAPRSPAPAMAAAREPTPLANPLPAPAPLVAPPQAPTGLGIQATDAAGATGLGPPARAPQPGFVADTTAQTIAEQRQARPAHAPAPAPVPRQRPAAPAPASTPPDRSSFFFTSKPPLAEQQPAPTSPFDRPGPASQDIARVATPRVNIDQAATTADRNRLNGYREIRELGASLPPGGGDAARSSPTVAPTPRTPPAVPKYITTTIKVAAPAKKPEPPEPVLPPPKGGMAGVGSVGGAAAQPKAAPQPHTPTAKMTELRTKTVQRINPAWVEQQKAAKAPVAVTARGGSGASARPVAKVEAPKPTGLGQGGNPLAGKKVMTQNHGEQMAGQRLNGSNRGLTVTGDTWFDSVRGI